MLLQKFVSSFGLVVFGLAYGLALSPAVRTARARPVGGRPLLAPLYGMSRPVGMLRRLLVAGPGSGSSEEPMSGVRSVTLDCTVVPEGPPGLAASRRFWSATIRA